MSLRAKCCKITLHLTLLWLEEAGEILGGVMFAKEVRCYGGVPISDEAL